MAKTEPTPSEVETAIETIEAATTPAKVPPQHQFAHSLASATHRKGKFSHLSADGIRPPGLRK